MILLQCPYFHVFFIIYQQQKEENRYSDSKRGWNVTVLVIDNNSFQIKKRIVSFAGKFTFAHGKAFRHSHFTKLWVPSDCRNSNRKCQHEFYNCIKDIQYRPETTCSRMDLLLEVKWLERTQTHTEQTNEPGDPIEWKSAEEARKAIKPAHLYIYVVFYVVLMLCAINI